MTTRPVPTIGERLARLGLPAGGITARRAVLPAPVQELHRRILADFAARGAPPDRAVVAGHAAAAGIDRAVGLEALTVMDLVAADPVTGTVTAAYPFSAAATRHRVRLATGVDVYAMCALDALGIPGMLGADAVIASTDPITGEAITVTRDNGRWTWRPATTVVLAAGLARADITGPEAAAADCSCPHINFHTGPDTAASYLRAHPGTGGETLTQPEAVEAAEHLFGRLMEAG